MPDVSMRGVPRGLARTMIVVALVLPFVLMVGGALVAREAGWPVVNGAAAGCLATFLLIGGVWIGLGIWAAQREVGLRHGRETPEDGAGH